MVDNREVGAGRPNMSHNSKSFSRIEPAVTNPLRSRASTLSHGVVSDKDSLLPAEMRNGTDNIAGQEDIFEQKSPSRQNTMPATQPLSPQEFPEGFDDLPIELISLIDR